jgi:hypothetical protein
MDETKYSFRCHSHETFIGSLMQILPKPELFNGSLYRWKTRYNLVPSAERVSQERCGKAEDEGHESESIRANVG